MARAYEDRRIRPAHRVASLAEEGTLEPGLAPFKTSPNTVRHYASELRKRRAGEIASDMAKVSHRDAIDALRVRFISATEHELRRVERSIRSPNRSDERRKADVELLKSLVRTAREAAALPEKTAPTPAAPGQRQDGEKATGKAGSADTLAGPLLKAHRYGKDALREPPPDLFAPTSEPDPSNTTDPALDLDSPARSHGDESSGAMAEEDAPTHA